MPEFAYTGDADLEVDGTKGTFQVYGDLGEHHSKSREKTVYGHLYLKV